MIYYYLVTHEHRHGSDAFHIRSNSNELDDLDFMIHDPDTFELFRESEWISVELLPDVMQRILNSVEGKDKDELIYETEEIKKSPMKQRKKFVDSLDDFDRGYLLSGGISVYDLDSLIDEQEETV